ncbi:MAG: glycosyltransferase family 39 protein, partial [Proteobacteria bacterium]|nr:glycosyltransferase family 39 protein [Pseudomonadota bacterium]
MRSADRRAAALASSPASSPPAGRELRWLAAILLAAAALRVVAWWRTAVLFDDGPIFLYIAEAIGEGDWSSALAHPYHPLYPLLTWLAKGVAGTLEGGAVLVSVVAGTASVAALWAFLRAAFDPRTALVGAALIAVHPNALAFSSDVQSDGLYVALFLGGVALLWRALDGARPELAGWAGLAAGLAYLTRPEGLGVVLVGSALAALRVGSGRWQLAFTARWLAALGLGVAIAIAPYVVALRVETGHWLITQKMSPAAGADDSVRAESPARVLPRPTAGARVRPERDLAGASSALRDLYRSTAAGFRFEYAGLLILGLWAARRGPRRRDRGLFLGFFVLLYGAVLFTLAFGAGYVSRRHTLPPLLPLLGYAALGTVLVGEWATAGLARLGFAPARANRGGVGRGGLAVVLGLALVAF